MSRTKVSFLYIVALLLSKYFPFMHIMHIYCIIPAIFMEIASPEKASKKRPAAVILQKVLMR